MISKLRLLALIIAFAAVTTTAAALLVAAFPEHVTPVALGWLIAALIILPRLSVRLLGKSEPTQ